MLVLSVQCHKTIMVGNDIEIRVVHIDSNTVHLGINAPPEVPVYRKEAWEAIQCEDLEAAWVGS